MPPHQACVLVASSTGEGLGGGAPSAAKINISAALKKLQR